MFCPKCGYRLPRDAHFCAQCGSPVSEEAALQQGGEPCEDREPILVVRPVFVASLAIFATLPFQLFFTVWAGLFFGGFSLAAIQALKLPVPAWSPFAFFAAVAFFGIPYAFYHYKQKSYSRMEYRFYRTRQQQHQLGTIVLTTPQAADTYHHHRRYHMYQAGGIAMENIKNPDETYRTIKDLIETQKSPA